MCLLDAKILTVAMPIFCPHLPPTSISIEYKSAILLEVDAFYDNLLQMQLIYVIWTSSFALENRIAISKFATKHPKRQAHMHVPCQ